jgi:fructosamine-3-kinase
MFDGEYASLKAIEDTGTIKVPHPITVVDLESSGAALVMENIEFGGSQKPELLGRQLAL